MYFIRSTMYYMCDSLTSPLCMGSIKTNYEEWGKGIRYMTVMCTAYPQGHFPKKYPLHICIVSQCVWAVTNQYADNWDDVTQMFLQFSPLCSMPTDKHAGKAPLHVPYHDITISAGSYKRGLDQTGKEDHFDHDTRQVIQPLIRWVTSSEKSMSTLVNIQCFKLNSHWEIYTYTTAYSVGLSPCVVI